MTTTSKPMPLTEVDSFVSRHIGPSPDEQRAMLEALGYASLDEFIDAVIPEKIRFRQSLSTTCSPSSAAWWRSTRSSDHSLDSATTTR